MENFNPSSSSSSNYGVYDPSLISSESAGIYNPSSQFVMPYNYEIPYACPNNHSLSNPSFPFPTLQKGNDFSGQTSLICNGLRPELGYLDLQRTKVARIKRKLARQRSLLNLKTPSSSSSSSASSSSSSTLTELDLSRSMIYRTTGSDTLNRSGKRDLFQFCTPDNKKLRVLVNKELKNSDVGSLGRIVLPKREAEGNLPVLSDKEGIQMVLRDAYSSKTWTFKYKFWSNNKSRMYVLENTGDFVKQNRLENGDFLTIYEDESKNLYFSIKKAEKPAGGETDPTQSSTQSYDQMCLQPYDYHLGEEEEASLAVLIEQLNHKEVVFDANDILSLPMLQNAGNSGVINPPPSASYDDRAASLDDCYGGLGMLPDFNRYNY